MDRYRAKVIGEPTMWALYFITIGKLFPRKKTIIPYV